MDLVLNYLGDLGAAARAFQAVWFGFTITSLVLFFSVLGLLASGGAFYIFAVYFLDMRKKCVTDC